MLNVIYYYLLIKLQGYFIEFYVIIGYLLF
jgi:hypothetical protein